MRRSDKEITDRQEVEAVIQRAQVCRLAMCLGEEPYVVPLNFGYREGKVYFHSAKEGRKIETIRANPRVCFEVDLDHQVVTADKACNFGFKFKSVIGFGRASLVEDKVEKEAALKVIMDHYSDGPHQFESKDIDRVAVFKVELESLTGKRAKD